MGSTGSTRHKSPTHQGTSMEGSPLNPVLDHARDVLERAGIDILETRELPTGLGHQLRCAGGQIVVVYRTGKVVPQGREAARIATLFAAAPPAPKVARPVAAPRPPPPGPAPAATMPAPTGPRLPPGWTTEPWDGISVPF